MALGIWIKRLRTTKDLKQTTVARRLGITQQAYSKLENCEEIGDHRLCEVLKAMDSNKDELITISRLFCFVKEPH